MNCPKCHGTGRLSFAYTQRYKVGYRCDYEGCMSGIIHCCDGIQEQPEEAKDETHKEAGGDSTP